MKTRPAFLPLLAVYPPLFLYSQNRSQLEVSDLSLPLLASLVGALVLWGLAFALVRDLRRSAVASAVLLVTLFGFGAAREAVGGLITSPLVLLAAWLAVSASLVLFVVFGLRGRDELLSIAVTGLNAASGLLLTFCVATLLIGVASTRRQAGTPPDQGELRLQRSNAESLPDIYYIVLDGYGGSEHLRRIYNYDNRPFLAALEQRGFYVARQSRSNYPRTIHSIAASLNMGYLNPGAREFVSRDDDIGPYVQVIRRNALMKTLERFGYRILALESGYAATDMKSRDGYIRTGSGLGEFENTLLNLTPIPVVLDALAAPNLYALHRERVEVSLELLSQLTRESGPFFVFAHILAPHPPFVFNRRGEPVDPPYSFRYVDGDHYMARQSRSYYIRAYSEQVEYITRRVKLMIDKILDESTRPPIIVLQGDHGPGSGFYHESLEKSDLPERMSILNAYYLPDASAMEALYPDISPVNSFRVILSHYLGEDLPLLPDRSFYSQNSRPYQLQDVTERISREDATERPAS